MKRECATCEWWKRDGADGICFYKPPCPMTVEKGKEYVVMWPRTNPDEFCSCHTPRKVDAEVVL